jgi:hypothetical protein
VQQGLAVSQASDATKAEFNAPYEKVYQLLGLTREVVWPLNVTVEEIVLVCLELEK